MVTSLAAALARAPIPLDGGLGTRLEQRGNDVSSALWSAELVRDDPSEVRAAHADFFAAGARAAITASYQVSYDGFARTGTPAETVDALLTRSVSLAREAAAAVPDGESSWTLASIGPYGASLGDGSEYTGDYGDLAEVTALGAWHRRRISILAAAAPDALIAETLPRLSEAEAICSETAVLGTPLILSFTVAGGRLRSGESLRDAARIAASAPHVIAVGLNCSDAAEVSPALRVLTEETGLPLVAYPNSGEVWNAADRTWAGAATDTASDVHEWVRLGARLVGGCCRVDVAGVRAIARALARDATA